MHYGYSNLKLSKMRPNSAEAIENLALP